MKIMVSEQFQAFMQQKGVDLNSTLEAAGINRVIWQEQLELSDNDYWRLMDALDNVFTDDLLLQFADIHHLGVFMPAFFAALSAKTGRQALERLATYKSLIGPVELVITPHEDLVDITIRGQHLGVEPPRFTVMTEQLLVLSLLHVGTGRAVTPTLVGSRYPYGRQISAAMGVQPQPLTENRLQFRAADLVQAFISANNVMWTYLQPELDRQKLAIEREKSLADNVQALLLKRIPSGHFAIDDIAAALNLSKRTLQRNLSTLGTTFNQEVQAARKTLVVPLMKTPALSLIEISYLLGYADPESFSRSFKKWYQQSPSAFRSRLLADSPAP